MPGVRGTPYLILRLPLRTRFLLLEDSAQVLFKRCKKPLVSQGAAGSFVRAKELYVILSNDSREKSPPLWRQLKQWSNRYHAIIPPACMGCGAAPSIPARRLD